MPDGLTFQAVVTPAGALVAATGIKLLVDLIKAVFPRIDAAVSGAVLAFIGSAVLYLAAALALPGLGVPLDANGYLNVVLTWLSCAAGAVGITAAISHARFASNSATLLVATGTIGHTPEDPPTPHG